MDDIIFYTVNWALNAVDFLLSYDGVGWLILIIAGVGLWPFCYLMESFDLWWTCNVEPKRQEKFRRWYEENMVHIGNNRYVGRDTVMAKEYFAAQELQIEPKTLA